MLEETTFVSAPLVAISNALKPLKAFVDVEIRRNDESFKAIIDHVVTDAVLVS